MKVVLTKTQASLVKILNNQPYWSMDRIDYECIGFNEATVLAAAKKGAVVVTRVQRAIIRVTLCRAFVEPERESTLPRDACSLCCASRTYQGNCVACGTPKVTPQGGSAG